MVVHGVIDEPHVLIAALLPFAALPGISEHRLQLMLVEGQRVVHEPFQAVGPPFLVVDVCPAGVTVPKRLAGCGRRIEIGFQVVVLQGVAEGGVEHVLLHLKDVEFHVGIAEQIDAVAIAHILSQIIDRVVNVGG